MRDELPEEIQSLIGQCEVGVNRFTNDQMSAALYFAENCARGLCESIEIFERVPVDLPVSEDVRRQIRENRTILSKTSEAP